jgi:hypothetical protein
MSEVFERIAMGRSHEQMWGGEWGGEWGVMSF